MTTYAAQASTAAAHGTNGPSSGRRSVPTASVRLVHRPVSQRWCERPRCPALRVAPAPGDGVVHTIAGRALCHCLCRFVRKKRAARVPVCVDPVSPDNPPDKSARTLAGCAATFSGILATNAVPIACLHHRAFDSRAVLGVVNALRCASTRPKAGPAGIDDASARHDVGYCAMARFLMARADRKDRAKELTRHSRRRILMYRVCAARHILRIAHSACGARFQSSPSGHDSSAPPQTSRQVAARLTLRVKPRT